MTFLPDTNGSPEKVLLFTADRFEFFEALLRELNHDDCNENQGAAEEILLGVAFSQQPPSPQHRKYRSGNAYRLG